MSPASLIPRGSKGHLLHHIKATQSRTTGKTPPPAVKVLTSNNARDKLRRLLRGRCPRVLSECVWVPRMSEENREAGENPARSRHCEGRQESRRSKPGDLPNA